MVVALDAAAELVELDEDELGMVNDVSSRLVVDPGGTNKLVEEEETLVEEAAADALDELEDSAVDVLEAAA